VTAHKCFTAKIVWWAYCWAWGLATVSLQTLHRQNSFCGNSTKKEFIWITYEALRDWNTILNRIYQHWPRNTSQSRTNHTKNDKCLSPRRQWTTSASSVRLYCKFFLTRLSPYTVTPKLSNTVVIRVAFLQFTSVKIPKPQLEKLYVCFSDLTIKKQTKPTKNLTKSV
jgi:hypothetical protein